MRCGCLLLVTGLLPASVGLASYVDLRVSERAIGSTGAPTYSSEITVNVAGISTSARPVIGVDVATSDVADPFWDFRPVPNTTPPGYFPMSSSYSLELSTGDTLSGLVSTMETNWRIRLSFADGLSSVYAFSLNTANITAGQFVGVPRITSPLDGDAGVAADATVTWTTPANWIDTCQVIGSWAPLESEFRYGQWLSNVATSWTPDWTSDGIAADSERIIIEYSNLDVDTISALTLVSGQPVNWAIPGQIDFGDMPTLRYVSSNEITVNVVPEPVSLGMLAAVGLLVRRRRRSL